MSEDVLVKVENISKKFCRTLKRSLFYGVKDIACELAGRSAKMSQLRAGEFWAIDNVTFELKKGECLGLIGPNGAGKSTLLKMLNGLIKPDHGQIISRGRVGALIELGAGFNPILTGRENIYVNGAILGMSKSEIDDKFEAIVEYSELQEFIDTPVKNYSTGMKVRLGFSIAAQVKPDVLLIDEVLAVGDVGFRAKCYNTIADLQQQCAIIFVSHSMTHIGRLATKTMLLNKGGVAFFGDTQSGIAHYHELCSKRSANSLEVDAGNGLVKFGEIIFRNKKSEKTNTFQVGELLRVGMDVKSSIDRDSIVIDIAFFDSNDEFVAQCNNYVFPKKIPVIANRPLWVEIDIPHINLNPGTYRISALIHSADMVETLDWRHMFTTIEIQGVSATAAQQFHAEWSLLEK